MDTASPTADHDLLIEVNTNVKNLTQTVNAHIAANGDKTNDHENRLRLLETANSELKGAQKSQKNQMALIGLVGTVVSIILGVLTISGN